MDKVINIRLEGQQLAGARYSRPGDLVGWMGMVQAQDYDMAKWALGLRLKEGTLGKVNEAMERGEIVRTHVMRPTWHFVAGEDIRWMLKLSGERVKKGIDQWTKSSGLDISESQYTQSNDQIVKVLSGHHCLTREEMEEAFGNAGIRTDDDRMKRYLLRAEVEGIICSGGDRNGKPTYALLDDQVAPVRELHTEEALGKLALNYFRSHSPATLKDFVWWSGLTLTEARKAIGMLGDRMITERIGEVDYLIYESCREAAKREGVHFLPAYDEYLISYKERCAVIRPEHCPKAYNNYGIFHPVILCDGRIVGNWKKTVRKGTLSVGTSFFEPEWKVADELLEGAEGRYREFRAK